MDQLSLIAIRIYTLKAIARFRIQSAGLIFPQVAILAGCCGYRDSTAHFVASSGSSRNDLA
jgi:hypothetical protein